MARIPLGDFGQEVAQPGRGPHVPGIGVPGALFDTGLGRQISLFGEEATQAALREQQAQRASALQEAMGGATTDLAELEDASSQVDWREAPETFDKGVAAIREKYGAQLTDPVVRQAFEGQFRRLALSRGLSVRKEARGRQKDYNRALLDENLQVYAQQAGAAKSPEEQSFLFDQATVAIQSMHKGGWITAQEAVDRQQKLKGRVEEATALRLMGADAGATATRLESDQTFLPNLDVKQRAVLVDQGYRRAEQERARGEREEEKRKQARADELLKDAWDAQAKGALTQARVDELRPLIPPGEYHTLLNALKRQGQGTEDNHAAFADVIFTLDRNPEEARAKAAAYHAEGKIKDSTLSQVFNEARSLERQGGPKTPYERTRAYISTSLDPGQLNADPVARARQGRAVKELDDWMAQRQQELGKPPPADEIGKKGDEIISRLSLVDMNDLVLKTATGRQNDPKGTLAHLQAEAKRLYDQKNAGQITVQEYNRRMDELNRARKAAEKAANGR